MSRPTVVEHKSRMARFEQALKKMKCPKCEVKRLIPKVPGNYRLARCMGCGSSFMSRRQD